MKRKKKKKKSTDIPHTHIHSESFDEMKCREEQDKISAGQLKGKQQHRHEMITGTMNKKQIHTDK